VYNVPLAARLSCALDAAVLQRALGEVVRRHEALRTVFPRRGGEPVQVVLPAGEGALRCATCPRSRPRSAKPTPRGC
jgi:hypothetical protein